MTSRPYIFIAGSIGVGKTTLAHALNRYFEQSLLLTETRDIYLARYYEDPKKFAFLNQLSYSLQYLEQAIEIADATGIVIQDRSIYDTHNVFTVARYQEGLISDEELSLLERIYRSASRIVTPSVLVLLETSVENAFERMQIRGIEAESTVSLKYLEQLSTAYKTWFDGFDLCPKFIIDTTSLSPKEICLHVISECTRLGIFATS